MSAIFISHSSADNTAAAEMKAWLEAQGHTSLFLDFDPEAGIAVGTSWEQTLYRQLRQCQAVIALLTPNWLTSKWCFAELVQAREHGKAIFPVKVQPCDAGGVFGDIQHIDLTAQGEEGYRRLRIGLLERGLDPLDVFDWNPGRPPYPGLLAFQEADAAIFFGRGEDTLKILETLDGFRRQGQTRFGLLLGASGSGKSSLVRAGVIPRLKKRPAEWLHVPPFRPQMEPLDELALALTAAFASHQRPRDWRTIQTELHAAAAQNPANGLALVNLARDLSIAAQQPEAAVLLTLDQTEELFGYSPPEAATRFLRLLRSALEGADPRLLAVATLRSDFLGEFQNHPALQDTEYGHYIRYQAMPVDPMPLRNFPSVIQGPARLAGLQLDDGLVEAMVRDTGTRDALPLLAFTLRRLYERYGHDGRLTIADYENLGALEGSVRDEAQRIIVESNPTPTELEGLHAAFVPTMVRINADGGYARRRAMFASMMPEAVPLLRRFVDARLLVTDRDRQGRETVEVAHEALLRTWPQLVSWLAEDQDRLRLLEGIQRAAAEWNRSGLRDDLLIHRNGRLKEAEALLVNQRFQIPEPSAERAYLVACREVQLARDAAEKEDQERRIRDAERIAEEQRKAAAAQRSVVRRTRIGLAAVAAVAVLAVAAAVVAIRARYQSQESLEQVVSGLTVQLSSADSGLVVAALEQLSQLRQNRGIENIVNQISDSKAKSNPWVASVALELNGRESERRDWVRTVRVALAAKLSAAKGIQQPPSSQDDERLNRRIPITGGSFQMGSPDGTGAAEARTHRVTVSPFRIQEHEVTNEEYEHFDPKHNLRRPSWAPLGAPDEPVVGASWYDAMAYAAWLGGTLPTEAQWEFAARGETGRPYPWGSELPTCERANTRECGKALKPVRRGRNPGSTPEPEGVNDLAGNVWEWCRNWDGPDQEQADPRGPANGLRRVALGGSYTDPRGARRYPEAPEKSYEDGYVFIGFRVVWRGTGGTN